MTPFFLLGIGVVMTGTAFLSGVFGMAGGLVLIGVLLALLPLPTAMALHAVTQIASNLWRALLWRRHVAWRAAVPYLAGSALAIGGWSFVLLVPDKGVAILLLGLSPFSVRLLPSGFRPDPTSLVQGPIYGAAAMTLMLLTGVSDPLTDTFFLGGTLDRRQIVATKAVCQVFGHAAKLLYFGGLIDRAASLDPTLAVVAVATSMLGTTLARHALDALGDRQFRLWANHLITALGLYCTAQGAWLLAIAG